MGGWKEYDDGVLVLVVVLLLIWFSKPGRDFMRKKDNEERLLKEEQTRECIMDMYL